MDKYYNINDPEITGVDWASPPLSSSTGTWASPLAIIPTTTIAGITGVVTIDDHKDRLIIELEKENDELKEKIAYYEEKGVKKESKKKRKKKEERRKKKNLIL